MLKDLFLSYVEHQNSAEAAKYHFGTDDPKTIEAFRKANELKRSILNRIEELSSNG